MSFVLHARFSVAGRCLAAFVAVYDDAKMAMKNAKFSGRDGVNDGG